VIVAAQSGDWKLTAVATPASKTEIPVAEPGIPKWIYGLVGIGFIVVAVLLFRRSKQRV